VVIGGPIQLSGKFGKYGTQAQTIADMWKEKLNADESFPFTIDINFQDDGSSGAKALSLTESMLNPRTNDSPDVFIPPYTSGNSKKVCDRLDDKNYKVMCGIWGGASESIFAKPQAGLGNNLRVQSFTPARKYCTSGLEFAYKKLTAAEPSRKPTVALMSRKTDAFSKSLCEGARDNAILMGYNVTQFAVLDPLEKADGSSTIYADFKTHLPSKKVPFVDTYDVITNAVDPLVETEDLADVIVACGLYDSNMAILLSLISRSIRPKVMVMTNAFDARLVASVLPYNVLDIISPTQWEPDMATQDEFFGTSPEFYANFKKRVGKGPSYHGASFGGLMTVLARALKYTADSHTCTAGECELDAAALVAAFKAPDDQVSKESFYGLVKVNEHGMNDQKPMLSVQIALGKGGSVLTVPAAPEAYIPSAWAAQKKSEGVPYPMWPARSWSDVKIDFLNTYCGGHGLVLNDMSLIRATDGVPRGPIGTFALADVGTCKACPVGTARPLTLLNCMDCAPGTFAAKEQQARCDLCPVGTSAPKYGQTSCGECQPGYVAGGGGRDKCDACPAGQFMDLPGNAMCKLCALGEYQPEHAGVSCEKCSATNPHLTTAAMASVNASACVCKAGFFHRCKGAECDIGAGHGDRSNADFCEPCPEGMVCKGPDSNPNAMGDNGKHTQPALLPGFWSNAENPTQVYLCRKANECEGGVPQSCVAGSKGLMCQECETGWYFDGVGCSACDPSDGAMTPVITTGVLAVMLTLAYRSAKKPAMQKMPAMQVWAISLGCVLTSFQVLHIFSNVLVPWPPEVKAFLTIFAIFSFQFDMLHAQCSGIDGYAMGAILPLLVCCIYAVVAGLSKVLGPKFSISWTSCVNAMGLMFQAFFIVMFMHAFAPFHTYEHPGDSGRGLLRFPTVLEGDDTWKSMMVVGIIQILVYVPFMLMICVAAVQMRKLTGKNQRPHPFSGFLLTKFKPEASYWCAMMIGRGMLLSIIPSLHVPVQVHALLIMLVLAAHLSVHCRVWPFQCESHNIVEAANSGMLVMLIFGGTLYLDFRNQSDMDIVNDMLFAICFILIFSCGFALLYSIFVILRERSVKVGNKAMSKEERRIMALTCDSKNAIDIDALTKALSKIHGGFEMAKCVDILGHGPLHYVAHNLFPGAEKAARQLLFASGNYDVKKDGKVAVELAKESGNTLVLFEMYHYAGDISSVLDLIIEDEKAQAGKSAARGSISHAMKGSKGGNAQVVPVEPEGGSAQVHGGADMAARTMKLFSDVILTMDASTAGKTVCKAVRAGFAPGILSIANDELSKQDKNKLVTLPSPNFIPPLEQPCCRAVQMKMECFSEMLRDGQRPAPETIRQLEGAIEQTTNFLGSFRREHLNSSDAIAEVKHFTERTRKQYLGIYTSCHRDLVMPEAGYRPVVQKATEIDTKTKNDNRLQKKDKVPDLYMEGAGLQASLNDFCKTCARETGVGEPIAATCKGLFRIMEKATLDGSVPKIRDISRSTIQYKNMSDMLKGLEYVDSSPKVKIIRIKDRWSSPSNGGWADIMINVVFPENEGHVCEIQFTHKQMSTVRKEMGAHHSYGTFRAAEELLELIGKQ
jgi:hypothetical protein